MNDSRFKLLFLSDLITKLCLIEIYDCKPIFGFVNYVMELQIIGLSRGKLPFHCIYETQNVH